MRKLVAVVALLCLVMLVLPTVLGRLFSNSSSAAASTSRPATIPDGSDGLRIRVYFPTDRRVVEMPLGEYLKGVVAAEMPPHFETEALKAQFIVARTYAVRRMRQFAGPGRGGCQLHPGADICADVAHGQAYISREQTAEKYGRYTARKYWVRLDQIQAETDGLVLRYRGALIDPLYHAVSGRVTENVENYYQQPLPYLTSVDDRWGADAPNLRTTVRIPLHQFLLKLSSGGVNVSTTAVTALAGQGESPVEIVAYTDTGRVARVRVGGVELTGRRFRELLGLRSTDFEVGVDRNAVVITTVGYGHGVGMSQYGANGMARAGKSHVEILQHYYRGVTISTIFGE